MKQKEDLEALELGPMREEELEEVMVDFVAHRFDLLLATTRAGYGNLSQLVTFARRLLRDLREKLERISPPSLCVASKVRSL